jgi:hypothetical protein
MTISLDPKGGKEFSGEMGEILEEILQQTEQHM